MTGFNYFRVGNIDPTFYREPVGREFRALEVWLRPFQTWKTTTPRRHHGDAVVPVAAEDVPERLRERSDI